jgi:hypothetical protein
VARRIWTQADREKLSNGEDIPIGAVIEPREPLQPSPSGSRPGRSTAARKRRAAR